MTFLKKVLGAKGDLPEGYSIELDDQPVGLAQEEFADYEEGLTPAQQKLRFDILVTKEGEDLAVAEARFLPHPNGKGVFSGYTDINDEHQRKGIGNAIYVYVEKVMKHKIFPSPNQDPGGKAFWNQPNRPFGNHT